MGPSTIGGVGRTLVDRLPAHALAGQQGGRVPGRFGEPAHEFAAGDLAATLDIGHREQALDRGVQQTLAGDVAVDDAHRQTRQHRDPGVPHEARAAGHDPLRRCERFPLLAGRRQVEAACDVDRGGGDDGLAVFQNRAEVALHGRGQTVEFVRVVARRRRAPVLRTADTAGFQADGQRLRGDRPPAGAIGSQADGGERQHAQQDAEPEQPRHSSCPFVQGRACSRACSLAGRLRSRHADDVGAPRCGRRVEPLPRARRRLCDGAGRRRFRLRSGARVGSGFAMRRARAMAAPGAALGRASAHGARIRAPGPCADARSAAGTGASICGRRRIARPCAIERTAGRATPIVGSLQDLLPRNAAMATSPSRPAHQPSAGRAAAGRVAALAAAAGVARHAARQGAVRIGPAR